MAFHVPASHSGFFADVVHRFRQLLHRGVVTGIDPIRLNVWLAQFTSEEERYLAAQLLSGLTYRSDAMVKSSFQHLAHCELPGVLRSCLEFAFTNLDDLDCVLRNGTEACFLRFVAIDGTFEKNPGKSGAVVIRAFRQHLRVAKALTCRPEAVVGLPDEVKILVFIDDIVGTGRQFATFAKAYDLSAQAAKRTMVYCPLLAFDSGLNKVRDEHPWLQVFPVEMLDQSHQFFRAAKDDANVWGVDGINRLEDAKEFVREICVRHAVAPRSRHSLDLLVAFEHAVPNNSLSLLGASSDRWRPLFDR